jgi:hypothetical protein
MHSWTFIVLALIHTHSAIPVGFIHTDDLLEAALGNDLSSGRNIGHQHLQTGQDSVETFSMKKRHNLQESSAHDLELEEVCLLSLTIIGPRKA